MDTHASDNIRTIATAYLHKAGNEQHKIWLSREHLHLLYHGRYRVFELQGVRSITFNNRKLMLPLVAGGITATLSLVAIFKTYASPWLMLSLLVAGILAAYLGYLGSWVLTVYEDKYHQDFYLKDITPNLRAFVKYANTFTSLQTPGMLYLPLSMQEWEQARPAESLVLHEKKKLCFQHEISSIPPTLTVVVPVNSLDEQIGIQWEPDEQGALYPCLMAGSFISLREVQPFFRQPTA